MSLLGYAVLRAETAAGVGPIVGCGGQSVGFVEVAGLAVAVSDHPTPVAAVAAELLAFNRVETALHEVGTVLPLRFGAWQENAAGWRRVLEGRCANLNDALSRMDGREEATLSVVAHDEVPAQATSERDPRGTGARFLYARRRIYAEQDARIAFCRQCERDSRELFAGLLLDARAQLVPVPAGGWSCSVRALIRRGDFPRLRERAAERRYVLPVSGRFVLLGPYPCHTFARLDGNALISLADG